MDSARDLAVNVFMKGIQQLKSKEEISAFAQMLCMMSAKVIHGIEGQEVKSDFLSAVIADNEPVMVEKVN